MAKRGRPLPAPGRRPAPPRAETSEERLTAVLAVALALLVVAVWSPVGGNGFTNMDDGLYLTENPAVKDGLTGKFYAWAWTATANGHPLTWLSHLIDVSLFGMRPGPMHLVSAVMHVASAVFLLIFLSSATGAPWRSAAVATLFAVHPLRVQSVARAAERKDVLSGLFFAANLLLYLLYARRLTPGRYLAARAVLRPRSDVQTDVGDSAAPPPAPRLLAGTEDRRRRSRRRWARLPPSQSLPGERGGVSPARLVGGLFCPDLRRPVPGRGFGSAGPGPLADPWPTRCGPPAGTS